jgi:hypothetical protein
MIRKRFVGGKRANPILVYSITDVSNEVLVLPHTNFTSTTLGTCVWQNRESELEPTPQLNLPFPKDTSIERFLLDRYLEMNLDLQPAAILSLDCITADYNPPEKERLHYYTGKLVPTDMPAHERKNLPAQWQNLEDTILYTLIIGYGTFIIWSCLEQTCGGIIFNTDNNAYQRSIVDITRISEQQVQTENLPDLAKIRNLAAKNHYSEILLRYEL